jgi:hypothetical protein
MKNKLKFIFNGDIYYSVDEVDKAIVDYIYKTESVGDIDVEETPYFEELWDTVVELKGVQV